MNKEDDQRATIKKDQRAIIKEDQRAIIVDEGPNTQISVIVSDQTKFMDASKIGEQDTIPNSIKIKTYQTYE